ncbi:MAG: hypothetical protein ACK5JE_01865 [Castellaniella sp.]|uniref:hypothetical protein n=1 Tax=Castellaniella sp. TaxID=1955812 RepID=UPI003A88B1CE
MTRIEDRHEGFSHRAGRSPPTLFSLGIPAAIVIMAQLRALQYQNRSRRMAPIVALVRLLYGYGYDHGQVRSLLRLIEWMLRLPEALEPAYLAAVEQLEQKRKMRYVTIAERLVMKRGLVNEHPGCHRAE